MWPILLRAGANLHAETDEINQIFDEVPYIRKVRDAGSIRNYEREHLNAISATFIPKFSRLLPPELVRRVVELAFHVGDY